jgi:hypothetical protein
MKGIMPDFYLTMTQVKRGVPIARKQLKKKSKGKTSS